MIEASDKFHQVANGEIRPLDWSTNISFTKESLPYEIEGKTEQTTYTGKNKLSLNSTTKTQAGVTVKTDTNGVITLSGTATSNSDIYVIIPKIILTAGTYTFSYNRTPTGSLALNTSLSTGSASWYFSVGYNGVAKTQTISSSITIEMIEFSVVNGTNYNGVTLKPQLEEGSTATDYEPYVGGVASPNPSYPQEVRTLTGEQTIEVGGEEYKINLSSRNILKFAQNTGTVTRGGITLTILDDNRIMLNGVSTSISTYELVDSAHFLSSTYPSTTKYISVKPNSPVTMSTTIQSGSYTGDTATSYPAINFAYNSSSTSVWNGAKLGNSYSTLAGRADGVYRLWLNVPAGIEFKSCIVAVQLEESSTPTEYTPYFEPTELAKVGNYQDRIFKASGKNLISGEYSQFDNIGGTGTLYKYFKLPDDGDYILSLTCKKAFTGTSRTYLGFTGTGGDGTYTRWILNSSSRYTVGQKLRVPNMTTTGVKLGFVSFYLGETEYKTIFDSFEVQLEKGTSESSYEPYGTDWYIKKETGKAVLTGTENWFINSLGYGVNNYPADRDLNVYDGYSDRFVVNKTSTTWAGLYKFGWNTGNTLWIREDHTLANSTADWKTWLGSHPTSIYYALATPTYTKVTGPLLDQLNYIYSQNLDYLNVKNSVLSISTSRSIEFPYTIQTATCDISLDNSHHQYSHSADNEGLGRYILPNRPVKVGLGFTNAEVVRHFNGNTDGMPSYQGENEEQVTFTAYDKLADIGDRHLPNMIMARDSRTDEVIYQILTDLGIPESQFVLERGTNIIPFVYFDADKSVGNALKELVQAENGSLWQDEEGIIRFEARDTNAFDKDVAMVLDSTNIKSVQPSRTDSLVNQVNIVADVRQIEQLQPVFTADNASGYSSQSEADNYRVASNGSTTIWLSFEDPVWSAIAPTLNAGSQTSSFSVVNLSGQAVNSGVTAICTLFATSYKITFANTNAFPVSISSISIWGEPAKLVGGQAVEYMAVDDESVEKYGTYPLEITDNKCFGSVENIKRYAIDVLQKYADYNAVVKVTAKADPALQIGDIVQLAVGKFNGRYQVKGIETTLDNGGLTTTLTLNLSVTGDKTPFILNKSKLDSSNEVLG